MNKEYELNPYTGDLEKIWPVYNFEEILKPVYDKIEDSIKNIKTVTINLWNSNIKMNQIENIVNKNKSDIWIINWRLNNIDNEINNIKQRLTNLENRMWTNESSNLNQNNEINLIKNKLQVLEWEINKLKNRP